MRLLRNDFEDLQSGFGKYLRWLHTERVGDAKQVQRSDVTLAALDLAHMRSVDFGVVGQCFLRRVAGLANSANCLTQRL